MSLSPENFVAKLQQCTETAPKELTDKIHAIASRAIARAMEEISEEAGTFLHEKLDDDKHTVEQVKAIIELFPESLSHLDEGGNLPIHNAAMRGICTSARSSVTFVPLMAKEGCRLGVGGEGNRGGLLSIIPDDDDNTIQDLACRKRDIDDGEIAADDEPDQKRTRVLEELRDMNLLKKADVEEYGLANFSLRTKCQLRFEFFSNLDPDCLGNIDSQWMVPIHNALEEREDKVETFEMVLNAGMKYFPERFGFLFLLCKEEGVTTLKKAFNKIGVDKAMCIVRKCIPLSTDNLILHRAVEHVPDLVDRIAQYYPDAVLLRDANGHTLSQVKFYINLRRGRRTFKNRSTFFLEATDEQVSSIDPKTGLCPFMLAAVNDKSDLTAVYYLLSRNPKLVGLHEKKLGKDYDEVRSSRKRQREGSSTLSI